MDQILQTIGDTIGDFFANPIVQLSIQLLFAYLVVIWLATSYWAFRDMQQRTANPVAPYLAAAGVILFTPFFFFFFVWIYKIIRPHEKIGEVWERNLAEEALLAEVESIHHCPTCDRRVNEEWIICPTCRTRLNRVCPNCTTGLPTTPPMVSVIPERIWSMRWRMPPWVSSRFCRQRSPHHGRLRAQCSRGTGEPCRPVDGAQTDRLAST